ncbi:MAG: hypothetical protein KDA52_13165 [Planctomycetaceae bacterium]|nr:hypothetical protein [Planctomycetaceae bacterium]
MQGKVATLLILGIYALGCDDVGGGGAGVNPYENAGPPNQGVPAAPPVPQTGSPAGVPGPPARGQVTPAQTAKPAQPPAPSLKVQDVGAHAVALSFAEYAKMTRRATEMLEELTKIHIAVDESADAEPYQDRWGELTADLAQLYADALSTGYPPQDVAEQLNDRALPQLKAALDAAAQAINEHSSVESGIDRCYADAEGIYKHMAHALSAAE